jgi:oligoribonuclease
MAYIIGDLETTGLDPRNSIILEVGYVVRERLLGFTPDEALVTAHVVDIPESVIAYQYGIADPYVQQMHTDNGLWASLANPDVEKRRLSRIDADIAFELSLYEGPHYLVGNSIRLDRAFIEAYMPRTAQALHYRQIDLSSTELQFEAVGRSSAQPKGGIHRVVGDVVATIKQLNAQLDMLIGDAE